MKLECWSYWPGAACLWPCLAGLFLPFPSQGSQAQPCTLSQLPQVSRHETWHMLSSCLECYHHTGFYFSFRFYLRFQISSLSLRPFPRLLPSPCCRHRAGSVGFPWGLAAPLPVAGLVCYVLPGLGPWFSLHRKLLRTDTVYLRP